MRKSVSDFSRFLMVRRAFGEGPLWGGTPKAERTPVLYYGGTTGVNSTKLLTFTSFCIRKRSAPVFER